MWVAFLTCLIFVVRNCLFRALGDQLEGHGRNHFKHRLDVVNYMLEHREDYEPFVEDDVPFDRHGIVFLKIYNKSFLV